MKTLKEAYAALPEFRKKLEEILDKELENGMKNIFLVGTGGTYSYAMPMTYFAKKTSEFPVYAENGKEPISTSSSVRALSAFTVPRPETRKTSFRRWSSPAAKAQRIWLW